MMAEYNIGDKFVVEVISKTDEPLAPYINSQTKNVTVYQLKGIPFMLDADTLSNFERFEERKRGKWESIPGEIRIERFTCCPCSECGWIEPHGNFCRHCGADMRRET